jgi:hypothetical protein
MEAMEDGRLHGMHMALSVIVVTLAGTVAAMRYVHACIVPLTTRLNLPTLAVTNHGGWIRLGAARAPVQAVSPTQPGPGRRPSR